MHLVEAPAQRAVVALYQQSADSWRYEFADGARPPVAISFEGSSSPSVGAAAWSDDTVWIDSQKRANDPVKASLRSGACFRGVSEEVWNFHVGGYQVCAKWLKERKGRILDSQDIAHFYRIVIGLHETVRLMREIDDLIQTDGGWPAAFIGRSLD
jgi:hypothetical protein